ncbi:MAG: 2,3-bisphosphoglycerate-independent phosphoglycerate mutase [Candidatus Bathyarchaeota archaeon]
MKAVIIICDGLADRPVKELNGKTPIEASNKPALDSLAKRGINGIMDIISPGIPAGSDTAHLALFGYNPHQVYRGRGAFEAVGAGIELKPEDVAFRFNFGTVDNNMIVVDRRAGRIRTETARELSKSLDSVKLSKYPNVQAIFRHTVEHRGALILRGTGLSSEVTDSDPEELAKVREAKPCVETNVEAKRTADIINELTKTTYEILDKHPINLERKQKKSPPANVLLFRGAGKLPAVTPLTQTYNIKAACIVLNALVRGVAVTAGMTPIEVPGATGTVETDAEAKAKVAVESLRKYDLALIHVKGSDNASHDGDFKQKIMMVEKIDGMVDYLLKNLNLDEVCIALTADHATPVSLKAHAGDPVPVSIAGFGVLSDSVSTFSERDCARGGLGRIRGMDFMPTLMNLLGKTHKFGA